ncbi:MAG: hypothetical protein GY861_09850 [bacterium]|nr:hypothetical protein [bacterium]
MEKAVKFLLEWAEGHVRHRDVIAKNIQAVETKDDRLVVKHKDKTVEYFVAISLDDIGFDSIDKEKEVAIATFNTKKNFDFLISKWNQLIEIKGLTIFFVNPLSQLEIKWIIKPYFHNKICDNASLKAGLSAMFETVEKLSDVKNVDAW